MKVETVASGLASELGIRVYGVGVTSVPRSGKPKELLALYGLDSASIEKKILDLLV
jgi:transketolase C-terminal domain/subunit